MKQINWHYINDYEDKGFRPLTFWERKINLSMIQLKLNTLSKIIDEKVKILMQEYINNNTEDVKNKIINILSYLQKEAFELWKKTASTEMKIQTPQSKKEIYWILKQSVDKVIWKTIKDIKDKIESEKYTELYSEEWIISQYTNWFKTLFLSWWLNLGRQVVFEQNPEMVYAFQYSAILDNRTTALCRKLDWMTVRPDSPEVKDFQPPNHWNAIIENTLIETNDWKKHIQDIKIWDYVLTHENRYCKVYDTMNKFEDKEYYEIILNNWYKLNITGEHPILTSRWWIRVDELNSSDKIICL